MPQRIHKLILSTEDKLPHESHSDCLINLTNPINYATGFRVCSSHIPVDAGTFSFYQNSLQYQLSSNYTFPLIKKIQFKIINIDTGIDDLNAEILLPNNTYTTGQLSTLFNSNFNYSGVNNWTITSNSITADFNATNYNRTVQLIAYNHNDEITNSDYININSSIFSLPKAETFNNQNNQFNYVFEELFSFPQIRRIICKYDTPEGDQLTSKLDLNDQIPVFNITQFITMLNQAFSTQLLATFSSTHVASTNLDIITLTGTGSANLRNRIINIYAEDHSFTKIEKDGHLNLKSIDIFVPAGQVMPATVITTQTNPSGKLSFDFSALNTITFNTNQVYTSQEIVDHLNTSIDEPANTAITFSKNGNVISIDNDTPNLAKTFLYIKKVELQITTPTKSTIQIMDFSNLPDDLSADSFVIYLNMFLTGDSLAGNIPGQILSYDITGNTLSVVPPSYHEDRTFKYTAYGFQDNITTQSGLNFPGTEFTVSANSTTASTISTNILFTSTSGIADTYANTTLTPRGKMSYDPNDILGFVKSGIVVNTGNIINGDKPITLQNNSDIDINFTSTMDSSTKIDFNDVISEIIFDPYETFTEATLSSYLTNSLSNFTFSFDDHRIKIDSSSSNKLRIYRNDKLGITFKKQNINHIDILPNSSYTCEAVLNGSTHIMSYLGLSIYNDSICSKKTTKNDFSSASCTDIVATLHNKSRMVYGDYLEQNNESTDIFPITTSQFQSIRVRSYAPNFTIFPNQHLPTHVELNVYCNYP